MGDRDSGSGDAGDGDSSDSWASRVTGTTPVRVDRDLWKLAWYSYGPNPPWTHAPWDPLPHPQLPPGWHRILDDDARAATLDPPPLRERRTGFAAMVFEDEHGHVVIAFRGTDDRADWRANALQARGEDSEQYDNAMALARAAATAAPGRVVLTGHSLGGGLAAAGALASGVPAVTFNAAGLHPHTARAAAELRGGGKSAEELLAEARAGLIRSYYTDLDALTQAQEALPASVPVAAGAPIRLEVPTGAAERSWERHSLRSGPAIGAVVGGLVAGLNPAGAAAGAAVGAAAGARVARGVYGHLYQAIDAGMEGLFPDPNPHGDVRHPT